MCLLLRSSWLTVEGGRQIGAAGVLHRRGGPAASAVSVSAAAAVPLRLCGIPHMSPPSQCSSLGECPARRPGHPLTTPAPTPTCGAGSRMTVRVWTTSIGCVGRRASGARYARASRGGSSRTVDGRVSVRSSRLADGRDDLPWDADAVDGMVRGGVADDQPKAWDLCSGSEAVLGIGSEQTAWAMLHRYRTAMVRPGRDRLGTIVEVDETVIGGPAARTPGTRRAGQDAGRDRGRTGRKSARPLPHADHRRREHRLTAAVPAGPRGARDNRDHRRVAEYPSACGRSTPTSPSRSPHRGCTLTNCCRACIASHRWCSAGCWAPTKAASSPGTCRHTWTSSRSASTAGDPARAACSSTACSSSPFKHPRAPTGRPSPTPGPAAALPRRHRTTSAYGLRASLVSPSIAHGVTNQPETSMNPDLLQRDGGLISA